MSNRDTEEYFNNLYDIDVSPSMISKITDKIIPKTSEWQSRQLEDVYSIVFMNAIHYSDLISDFNLFMETRFLSELHYLQYFILFHL